MNDRHHNELGAASHEGALMYTACACCGEWLEPKPGDLNLISHGLCPPCLEKELEQVRADTPGSRDDQ